MNIILASLEQHFFCKLVCNETQKKKSIYIRVEITRETAVLRQQQNLFSNWYFKKVTTVSNLARLGYLFIELFFVKKYLLVGAWGMLWAGGSVVQWFSGSVVQWFSGSVDQWISERCMYVTPIRLDLLLKTNQISCCKGKRYVRRFDPDTVGNGHIY